MGDLGPLAGALAKAQTQFPPIPRDKHVTVRTKDGGSYSFDYAPLDTIIGAVRGPLAANGLAVAQVLDDGDLITMLLHDSGAVLSGRVSLPSTDNIQGLGSAITYLRRYALQAVLGIAAEEDDDGNHAIGGSIAPRESQSPRHDAAMAQSDGPWSGRVTKGKAPVDLTVRGSGPETAFGFSLIEEIPGGRYPRRSQVLAQGDLAAALSTAYAAMPAETATVWGSVVMVPWDKDGAPMPPYRRIIASRIQTPAWTLPAVSVAPGEPDDLDGLDF